MDIRLGVLMVLALCAPLHAAVPQRINFQGRLTDAAGNPVTGTKAVAFSIWDAASAGSQLWSESRGIVVSTGIYNVALGDVTALSSAVFSGPDRWLQLQVEADAAMTPRLKLQSVAYALRAERAGGVSDATGTDIVYASDFGVKIATNLVVGVSTFSANGNINVPGSVTAGIFSGNGAGLVNLPWSSLRYPDGLQGMTPVWTVASLTTPYTVPAGKNFYILHVYPVGADSSLCTMAGVTNCVGYLGILGPGTVIASPSVDSKWNFNGFLAPNTVTVVLMDLAPSASYVVPASTTFVFYGAMNAGGISIDGVPRVDWWFMSAGEEPIVLGPGMTITNTGGAIMTINGYLKPQ